MDKPKTKEPCNNSKNKKQKQQPLKVVYITNPVKFKTSASEFRALVQELTGQDAELPESNGYNVVGGVHVAAEEATIRPVEDHEAELRHVMMNSTTTTIPSGELNGSDPFAYGSSSYEDVFYYNQGMLENFQGLVAWHDGSHDLGKN